MRNIAKDISNIMEKEKKKLSPKAKRIINIVVDVVVAIILAFALLLAVCTITSKKKGYDQYTEIFGTAYLAVASDSMEPVFYKGDLVKVKTINSDEAANLNVGDIITFRDPMIVDGKKVLNTHRIIEKNTGSGGVYYVTHGDHNSAGQNETVTLDQIVGVYQGKASGIGHVFLFMNTSAGFFVCVVLPTLLIVVYCAVNLILVVRKEKKKQTEDAALARIDERERIRQELLAEMQANAAETAQSDEVQQQTESEPAAEQNTSDTEVTVAADEKGVAEENKTDEDEK